MTQRPLLCGQETLVIEIEAESDSRRLEPESIEIETRSMSPMPSKNRRRVEMTTSVVIWAADRSSCPTKAMTDRSPTPPKLRPRRRLRKSGQGIESASQDAWERFTASRRRFLTAPAAWAATIQNVNTRILLKITTPSARCAKSHVFQLFVGHVPRPGDAYVVEGFQLQKMITGSTLVVVYASVQAVDGGDRQVNRIQAGMRVPL